MRSTLRMGNGRGRDSRDRTGRGETDSSLPRAGQPDIPAFITTRKKPSFTKNTFRRLFSYAGEFNRSEFDPVARLPPKPAYFSMALPVNCSLLSQVFRSVSSYGQGKNRRSRN